MKKRNLKIEGMTCQHCVMAVKKELEQVEGLTVKRVEIGRAEIEYDENLVSDQRIADAVDEAGYQLEN